VLPGESRCHIRDRKEIHEVILAGLDIDFDLGELATKEFVAPSRDTYPSRRLPDPDRQGQHRCFRHFVDVFGRLVTVVAAAELDRALSSLREGQPRSAALAEDALVGYLVILGLPPRLLAAISWSFFRASIATA